MRRLRWLIAAWGLSAVLLVSSVGAPAPRGEIEAQDLTVERVELVSPLTGPDSPARTDGDWNIAGTDNGISFEHDGELWVVFGDTWGRDGIEGVDWRSNTMGTVEPHPEFGYVLTSVIEDERGEAKELLGSEKEPGTEYTVMPTAGIAVGDRMYLHYMSIRDWKTFVSQYKEPVVNGAGFAYSDDGGQTWIKDDVARWEGDSAFTQAAIVEQGNFVYVFGTPAGRFGHASLFRVPGEDLLDPEQYEYWTEEGWSPDESEADALVPAPVGELSVRWSAHHQRWLMMYRNEAERAIVLRTARQLEGPWDDERIVLTSGDYPRSYAPFMLPIDGPDVYFNMSVFIPDYQVYVMRMTLSS